MGFLQQLLSYKSICIQCHNNPDSDTLALAYGEGNVARLEAPVVAVVDHPI